MNGSVSVRKAINHLSSQVWEEGLTRRQIFFTLPALVSWLIFLLPVQGECRPFLYLTPSFSAAELYEDNVFRKPNAKGDAVSRFSPGLEASYMALPFELRGFYHFDSEIYAKNTRLNQAMSRQYASLGGSYILNPSLTLATDVAYLQSHMPEEHNATTGLFAGRASTKSILATPSAFFRLTRTLTGDTDYSFSRSDRRGLITTSHRTHTSLHWRLTRRDTLSFSYAFRQYLSSGQNHTTTNGGNNGDTSSNVITMGWMRRLSPRTSISLEGGPRFSGGGASPEVRATIDQLLGRKGKFSLSYGRSQHTVAGETGPVDIQYFRIDGFYQLQRFLSLEAAFAYGDNEPQSGPSARTYNANLVLTYILNRYCSLLASYTFRYQNHDILGGNNGDILSDIVMVRLTFSAPTPYSLQ